MDKYFLLIHDEIIIWLYNLKLNSIGSKILILQIFMSKMLQLLIKTVWKVEFRPKFTFTFCVFRCGAFIWITLSVSKSVCIISSISRMGLNQLFLQYRFFLCRICFLRNLSFLCNLEDISFYPVIVRNKIIKYLYIFKYKFKKLRFKFVWRVVYRFNVQSYITYSHCYLLNKEMQCKF